MRFSNFYNISCLIFICCALQKTAVSGDKSKHVYFQIDEFIKQLMTSDKFEELADIIADKAVEKIKNMESGVTTPLKSKALRDRPIQKKTLLSQDPNGNRDQVKSGYNKKRKQKLSKPKQFGKIDTQAFLQKHLTSKELELNFKHLTGELEKHKTDDKHNAPMEKPHRNEKHKTYNENERDVVKDNMKDDVKRDVLINDDKKNDDSKANKEGSLEKRINTSKEKKITLDGSTEDSIHEKSSFHEEKKSSEELKNSNISESPKENKYAHRDSPKLKLYSDDDNTEKKIRKESSTSLKYQNEKVTEVNQDFTNPISSSKEILEIGINRAYSNENVVSNPNITKALEQKSSRKLIHRQNKRKIRVENGKMYTFNSSPDYAEYHENRH